MDFDSILPKIGEFGKYQKLIFVALCIPACFPCCFTFFKGLFMAHTPDHWCKIPELSHLDVEVRKNLSLPMEFRDGLDLYSQCRMYDVNYTRLKEQGEQFFEDRINWTTTTCKYGWEFDRSEFSRTLVSEMEVVCDKTWLIGLSETVFFAGGLLGNFFFGWFSDKCGRRLAFMILLFSNVTMNLLTSFVPNFTWYIIVRGFVGMTFISLYNIPFVLTLELMSPYRRCFGGMVIGAMFSVGMMFLALFAWIINDWFYLSIATSAPFYILLSYWWFLPESPRWLLAQNRVEDAEKIVQKIAKVNKKSIPPNFLKSAIKNSSTLDTSFCEEEPTSFLDIYRHPMMRKRMLKMNFCWICNEIVYVGLSLTSTSLGGNEYMAFALSGLVEIPGIILSWYCMDHIGRRITLFVSMIGTGLFCLATAFLNPGNTLGMLILSNLGKLAITGSFSVMFMYAGELFPTCLRSVALSMASLSGSAAMIVAPQILRAAESYHRILPILFLGSLALMGGITGSFLPETLGTSLPQTVKEGENFDKHFRYWKFRVTRRNRRPEKV